MSPPIPRPGLKDTLIGFKPDPPERIVVQTPPCPHPDPPPHSDHLEPRLTDSPAFLLIVWTLIGLVVGIAWTL